MARKDGKPETQHYVPKALLRGFVAKADGEQIYLYDKRLSKSLDRPTSINNVGAERNYYEAETQTGRISLEAALKFLEDEAGTHFKVIRQSRKLGSLEDADRAMISLFAASQFLRTPRIRTATKQLREAVLSKAQSIAPDGPLIAEIEKSIEKNALKILSMQQILATSHQLAALLLEHHWVLLRTNEKSIWISDCPVVMHNDKTFGPYGNLGFALPGIQIYLPIASDLVLAFWSKDILEEFKKAETDVLKAFRHAQAAYTLGMNVDRVALGQTLRDFQTELARVRIHIVDIEQGFIDIEAEQIKFLNWLQYVWSNRFIMSSRINFQLAAQIGLEHPELREGIRLHT